MICDRLVRGIQDTRVQKWLLAELKLTFIKVLEISQAAEVARRVLAFCSLNRVCQPNQCMQLLIPHRERVTVAGRSTVMIASARNGSAAVQVEFCWNWKVPGDGSNSRQIHKLFHLKDMVHLPLTMTVVVNKSKLCIEGGHQGCSLDH